MSSSGYGDYELRIREVIGGRIAEWAGYLLHEPDERGEHPFRLKFRWLEPAEAANVKTNISGSAPYSSMPNVSACSVTVVYEAKDNSAAEIVLKIEGKEMSCYACELDAFRYFINELIDQEGNALQKQVFRDVLLTAEATIEQKLIFVC